MSTHRSKPRDLEISVPGLYGANPNELINIHLPLRLVSLATGRVKLQRSHASQAGERGWEIEGGRERENDAGDDQRGSFRQNESKEKHSPEG